MDLGAISRLYDKHYAAGTAISPHLPRLRALSAGLTTAVEFGVKRGASSTALLLGAQNVISYDIKATPEARELELLAGEAWKYRLHDSVTAVDVPFNELLFIDSQHDYKTCKAELDAHADKALGYLVFHDVTTFGEVAADGETGRHRWTYQPGQSCPPSHWGIRPAIDALMVRDPSWRIAARYVDSHGLLVLERRS